MAKAGSPQRPYCRQKHHSQRVGGSRLSLRLKGYASPPATRSGVLPREEESGALLRGMDMVQG